MVSVFCLQSYILIWAARLRDSFDLNRKERVSVFKVLTVRIQFLHRDNNNRLWLCHPSPSQSPSFPPAAPTKPPHRNNYRSVAYIIDY